MATAELRLSLEGSIEQLARTQTDFDASVPPPASLQQLPRVRLHEQQFAGYRHDGRTTERVVISEPHPV